MRQELETKERESRERRNEASQVHNNNIYMMCTLNNNKHLKYVAELALVTLCFSSLFVGGILGICEY